MINDILLGRRAGNCVYYCQLHLWFLRFQMTQINQTLYKLLWIKRSIISDSRTSSFNPRWDFQKQCNYPDSFHCLKLEQRVLMLQQPLHNHAFIPLTWRGLRQLFHWQKSNSNHSCWQVMKDLHFCIISEVADATHMTFICKKSEHELTENMCLSSNLNGAKKCRFSIGCWQKKVRTLNCWVCKHIW